MAFLGRAITEMILAGKAPAYLTLETPRSPESVPTALVSPARAMASVRPSSPRQFGAGKSATEKSAQFSPETAEFGTGSAHVLAENRRSTQPGMGNMASNINYLDYMAERGGFEPPVRFPVHTLSRRAP